MVKKDDFVNHHMHSFFSSLDGMPSPEDIMKRIIDLGQTSFSITDHGSLSAIPRAYQAAEKAGVGFTPGIEAYYTHDRFNKSRDRFNKDYYHMILLAYSNEGYHNLLKMQTTSWEDGLKGKYPRIDHEVLSQYHKGITATTSCLGGLIPQLLLRDKYDEALEELGTLVDIFGKDNVYIEVQNHHQNDDKLVLPQLLKLHKDTGVKMLATSDSHYCMPEDFEAHDALLCTGTKKKKCDTNRFKFVNDEFYIPSRTRMEEILPEEDFPGALNNTVELAEKTDFTLKINDTKEYLMPHIDVLPGMTEQETLRERVIIGAKDPKRYGDIDGNISQEVQDRIDYELDVIEKMGFAGYFIIVADMIKNFADHGIYAGPGRGCLHGDTLVVTHDGNKKICDVTTSDMVMTSAGTWSHVQEVIQHETAPGEHLVKISVANGQVLRLTEKHKVLVKDDASGDPYWVKARDITSHDSIACVNGDNITYHKIAYIDHEDVPEYVYDLTVKDGDPSFLTVAGTVHNSAPGSVVVYCMGITDVDPFEHGLFFERFLNPDRISMPDIDVDIPKSKRHKSLQIMEDKYGKGHVAHLANYTTMGTKDALNRISKVYEVTTKFTEIVIEYCDGMGISIQELAQDDLPAEITTKKELASYDDDTLNTVLQVSAKLEGTLASYGVHASGIVVTNTPIDDNFPIRISKTADLPVSQYDGVDVEKLGGVKIDILGLINLDQCEDAERNIELDLGKKIDSTQVPKDDKKVYEMLSQGEGGGVFQLGCLAADTMIDGMTIREMYLRRNSEGRKKSLRSVYLGEGVVNKNIVDKVVYSGKKQLFKVTTLSGNTIRATEDHKFFTNHGWKKLKDIHEEDHVVIVNNNIGTENNVALSVRDKEDIKDYYHMMHPDLIPVDYSVDTSYNTFDAEFRKKYPDYEHFIKLVPSNGLQGSKEKADNVNNDASNTHLDIVTYEEVMEEFYSTWDNPEILALLPEGTQWDSIVSITEDKVEDTFDIMMRAPVHNFVANGFMVHNSSGMQSLMRVLKPSEFKDLSALIALYRPGPMGMDTHNEYARRKNQGAEQTVLHPEMEKILKDNYNLIVYQEDIMALSRLLAGYTGGESDTLRKAMAKKNPVMMKQQEEKFVPAVNNKYGNHLGDKLWEVIKPFGAYAFNKCLHGRTRVVLPHEGSVRIQDLYKSDDYVGKEILSMWEDGSIRPHKIKNIVCSGRKPLYTVKTEKGRSILITEEHRLLTTQGYGTIADGLIHVGCELISDDNPDGGRKFYISDDRKRRSQGTAYAGRSDIQWNLNFIQSVEEPYLNQISRDTVGLGISTELNNGRIVDSKCEALAAEYLSQRSIEFEMHKEFVSCKGTVRITDFYAQGIYFEMDGMGRGRQWFVDNKYGEDIPFIYMTPYDYKDKIDAAIMRHNISNGDKVVEIIPPRISDSGKQYTEMTYDIEMEDSGPANFIANGLVSHNSHSVAYGFTTYRTAWLKTHYPAQFGGAVIDNILDKPDKLLEEILWMKRFGLKIYSPCVNNSQIRSVTTKDSIQLPIHLIKGIGYDVAQRIIDEREENGDYTSVVDFCSRNNINERTLVSIAKSGGFDSLGASRAAVVYNRSSIIAESKKQSSRDVMSKGLFGDLQDDTDFDDSMWTSPDAEPDYIIEGNKMFNVDIALYAIWEKEAMGVLIGAHPFELIKEYTLGRKLLGKYPAITEFKRPTRDAQAIGYMTDISSRTYVKNGVKKNLTKFTIETDDGVVPGVIFDKLEDPERFDNQFVYIEGNLVQDGMSDPHEGFHPNILTNKISPIKMDNIFKGGKIADK